jgi:hypothetical protein
MQTINFRKFDQLDLEAQIEILKNGYVEIQPQDLDEDKIIEGIDHHRFALNADEKRQILAAILLPFESNLTWSDKDRIDQILSEFQVN